MFRKPQDSVRCAQASQALFLKSAGVAVKRKPAVYYPALVFLPVAQKLIVGVRGHDAQTKPIPQRMGVRFDDSAYGYPIDQAAIPATEC
jgi:hypothetical protein